MALTNDIKTCIPLFQNHCGRSGLVHVRNAQEVRVEGSTKHGGSLARPGFIDRDNIANQVAINIMLQSESRRIKPATSLAANQVNVEVGQQATYQRLHVPPLPHVSAKMEA